MAWLNVASGSVVLQHDTAKYRTGIMRRMLTKKYRNKQQQKQNKTATTIREESKEMMRL